MLARVIEAIGAYAPEAREEVHPFQALAHAIAHQQLNGIAANSILARLVVSCGQGAFPTPQMLLSAPVATLRAAGFSAAKVAALRDLAQKTLAEVVPDAAVLHLLSDEEVIERLIQVRGIGRWTVEMLLMFHLGRPDVLPVDDFGVRSGFRAAYGLRRMPPPKVLRAFGERWKPYRSTAAWYLWRAVELKRAGRLPLPAERVRLPRLAKRRRSAAARSAHSARRSRRTLPQGPTPRPRRNSGRRRARKA